VTEPRGAMEQHTHTHSVLYMAHLLCVLQYSTAGTGMCTELQMQVVGRGMAGAREPHLVQFLRNAVTGTVQAIHTSALGLVVVVDAANFAACLPEFETTGGAVEGPHNCCSCIIIICCMNNL